MPFYDLYCPTCDAEFKLQGSVADKMEKRLACPQCGGHDLQTVYKPVSVQVKRENTCPNSHLCGGCCPHAH